MALDWKFEFVDVVIAFAVAIAALFLYFFFLRVSRPELIGLSFAEIRARWKEINDLMNIKKEMNWKLAIIEADKLLDHVLKAFNFQGGTLGDRLKLASYRFPHLKKVMWAHRVRNQIVHEANYHLRYGETKYVLKLYKKALQSLRVL